MSGANGAIKLVSRSLGFELPHGLTISLDLAEAEFALRKCEEEGKNELEIFSAFKDWLIQHCDDVDKTVISVTLAWQIANHVRTEYNSLKKTLDEEWKWDTLTELTPSS